MHKRNVLKIILNKLHWSDPEDYNSDPQLNFEYDSRHSFQIISWKPYTHTAAFMRCVLYSPKCFIANRVSGSFLNKRQSIRGSQAAAAWSVLYTVRKKTTRSTFFNSIFSCKFKRMNDVMALRSFKIIFELIFNSARSYVPYILVGSLT